MVPENTCTHPTEDHWKLPALGGGVKCPTRYEAKVEFQRGGGSKEKPFVQGRMDILWRNTITIINIVPPDSKFMQKQITIISYISKN